MLNMTAFECVDCGRNTSHWCGIDEYYMVHDAVWLQTGLAKFEGMLCIGCLERRIGRKLCRDDFTNYPINTDGGHSERLTNRMWGTDNVRHD
jgi:hypothetical protein